MVFCLCHDYTLLLPQNILQGTYMEFYWAVCSWHAASSFSDAVEKLLLSLIHAHAHVKRKRGQAGQAEMRANIYYLKRPCTLYGDPGAFLDHLDRERRRRRRVRQDRGADRWWWDWTGNSIPSRILINLSAFILFSPPFTIHLHLHLCL